MKFNGVFKTLVLVIGLSQISAVQATGAIYNVYNITDLRDAITQSNLNPRPDVINIHEDMVIDSANAPGTGNAFPFINSIITINGNGHTISRLSSAEAFRFTAVSSVGGGTTNGDLTLNNITFKGGYLSGFNGGAFYVETNSKLTLNNVTLTANSIACACASGSSGTVGDGGALYVKGEVVITNSNISHNTATNAGGGLFVSGIATIENSTISNNDADRGGAMFALSANVTVKSSTIKNNVARLGGGMRTSSSVIDLYNSTISRNRARTNVGAINSSGGIVNLHNCTVAENTQNGLTNLSVTSKGEVSFFNSIFIAPTDSLISTPDSSLNYDSNSIIQANGFSISGPNFDPQLEPLDYNGGNTQSHALRSTSPARNIGDVTSCTQYDQRGQKRDDGDGKCDVGAIEYNSNDGAHFSVIPLGNGKVVVVAI